MQHRIVRPAILSIVGVYSPFYIAAAFPLATPAGLEFFLGTGAWLSTISILLLLDTGRHRIWGLLTAISYLLAFPLVFFLSTFLTLAYYGTLASTAAWPAVIAPVVGLIGGIWGFLWRPPTTAIIPETEAVKEPSLSRFRSNNPLMPALLSLAGTALPQFLLYGSVAALSAPPQPPLEGSVAPNFGPLFLILIIVAAAFALLLLASFSILLLFDPRRHRAWGAVLIVLYGLASLLPLVTLAVVLAGLANGAPSGSQTLSWTDVFYAALYFTPLLGLAGGIWGFYWHTGVNPRAWTLQTVAKTLRGLSGRVTVGGLASLVCSLFASPVLAILPFVLVVANIQFGRSAVRSRARGLPLMGLVVASGLFLFAFEYAEYRNAWWEIGPRIAGLASLAATFLGGSGLVSSIKTPSSPAQPRMPEHEAPS